ANIERLPSFAPPKPASFSWLKSFSRFMKGAFMFLLVAGLVAATAAAVFWAPEAPSIRRHNWGLEEKERARGGGKDANGRAQNAWEQMEEALQLTQEAVEKASAVGAELTVSGEKSFDLDKYAYPGAQVEAKISAHGNQALSMLTRQNFDSVQSFYERLFGKPILQMAVYNGENQRKKVHFQSATLPSILVKVEESEIWGTEKNQVKITLLHSFLLFPRFKEVQAKM